MPSFTTFMPTRGDGTCPTARFDRYRPGDQLTVDRGQAREVIFLGQQLGLERLQPRVSAATRSQILSEPMSRKVGSCDRRSGPNTLKWVNPLYAGTKQLYS